MSVQGHIESRKFIADAVITAGLAFIAAILTLLFLVAMFTGQVRAQLFPDGDVSPCPAACATALISTG